jgi:hypothetical protein
MGRCDANTGGFQGVLQGRFARNLDHPANYVSIKDFYNAWQGGL